MPPDSAGHRQTGSDGRHRLIGGSVLDSLLCATEAVFKGAIAELWDTLGGSGAAKPHGKEMMRHHLSVHAHAHTHTDTLR